MIRFGRQATMTFEVAWAANCREESFVEILGDKAGARLLDGKPLTILTENEEHLVDVAPQFNPNVNLFESQAHGFAARCRGETPAEPFATGEEFARLWGCEPTSSIMSKDQTRFPVFSSTHITWARLLTNHARSPSMSGELAMP